MHYEKGTMPSGASLAYDSLRGGDGEGKRGEEQSRGVVHSFSRPSFVCRPRRYRLSNAKSREFPGSIGSRRLIEEPNAPVAACGCSGAAVTQFLRGLGFPLFPRRSTPPSGNLVAGISRLIKQFHWFHRVSRYRCQRLATFLYPGDGRVFNVLSWNLYQQLGLKCLGKDGESCIEAGMCFYGCSREGSKRSY